MPTLGANHHTTYYCFLLPLSRFDFFKKLFCPNFCSLRENTPSFWQRFLARVQAFKDFLSVHYCPFLDNISATVFLIIIIVIILALLAIIAIVVALAAASSKVCFPLSLDVNYFVKEGSVSMAFGVHARGWEEDARRGENVGATNVLLSLYCSSEICVCRVCFRSYWLCYGRFFSSFRVMQFHHSDGRNSLSYR